MQNENARMVAGFDCTVQLCTRAHDSRLNAPKTRAAMSAGASSGGLAVELAEPQVRRGARLAVRASRVNGFGICGIMLIQKTTLVLFVA